MKKTNIVISLAALATLTFSGCGGGGSSSTPAPASSATPAPSASSTPAPSATETPAPTDTTLKGDISASTKLTADKVWYLDGKVNVKSGVTLTVEPGTTIAGKTPASYMVVEPGAKLIAKGTQAEPIVFTSKKDADGKSGANKAG
ncbi:MAG TPA: hypothetical protein ENK79_00465, partial [Campylobacterales bacterium]|nr:hypothetical protein [Campylobacterales bacterium]